MNQEIDQIKAAERDAILRIDAAKKQADHLIQKAREDAAKRFENRREDAELEVTRIRENSLAHARSLSTEIGDIADRDVEEILTEGGLRIPSGVDLIVKRVIGGSDVLSGTNG